MTKPLTKKNLLSPDIKRFNAVDATACVLFVFFAVYYFIRIRYGLTMIDESFYYTLPHRYMLGDRLIVDEWHVSQFSVPLQYLPFKLFYSLTGGTDGVILYFRILFMVCWLCFFAYLYCRLRKFGWAGLAAAAVFPVFVPCTCMTLNYYNMSLMAMALVGTILFIREKHSAFVLFFCGFVFACGVLAEPLTAFIYFAYSVAVLIVAVKQKKTANESVYSFVVNKRHWLFLTVGICIAAATFFVFLLSRVSATEIIKAIPEFFTDSEYDFSFAGNLFDFSLFTALIEYFGYIPLILSGIIFIGLIVCRKTLKKNRTVIFAFALVALIVTLFTEYFGGKLNIVQGMVQYQPLPVFVFGLICFFLCEKKDKKLIIFWCFGTVYLLIMDISSECIVGLLSGVANIPGVLFIGQLISELLAEKKEREPKKADARFRRIVAIAAVCVLVFGEAAHLFVRTKYLFLEEGAALLQENAAETILVPDRKIEKGPYKGLYTTELVWNHVNAVMDDLDIIKEHTNGPVYVTALFSWCYLYLDLPYSTYSTWYVDADYKDRMLRWWKLHPDKTPAYVYIPGCNGAAYLPEPKQQQMEYDFITETFDCSIRQGKMGYIVKITGRKV